MKLETSIKHVIKNTGFKADYSELFNHNNKKIYYFKVINKTVFRVNGETLLNFKKLKNNYFRSIETSDGNFHITLYQFYKFSLSEPKD